jgi:hypothetical protein
MDDPTRDRSDMVALALAVLEEEMKGWVQTGREVWTAEPDSDPAKDRQ